MLTADSLAGVVALSAIGIGIVARFVWRTRTRSLHPPRDYRERSGSENQRLLEKSIEATKSQSPREASTQETNSGPPPPGRSSQAPNAGSASGKNAAAANEAMSKLARRSSEPLSASDLLTTVRALRSRSAQWPEIIQATNPSGDAHIHSLLQNLRGPHQFAPHVALNALEDGCERVISTNPQANASDALKETLRRVDFATNARD